MPMQTEIYVESIQLMGRHIKDPYFTMTDENLKEGVHQQNTVRLNATSVQQHRLKATHYNTYNARYFIKSRSINIHIANFTPAYLQNLKNTKRKQNLYKN